ncbi:PDZ domain-containing protein [Ruania zhangjianzhongii]|uniref:YlbL family protein n=1 Tax=Ruania zhangjianzhongii TaxID=2603206 RepID=UPI00143D4EFB|nr:S16 family serine protease [Ruania zhangjianzhongii]
MIPETSVPPPGPSRWQQIRQRYRIGTRAITMVGSGLAAFGLLVAMLLVPVPYAVEASGPTFNTLGEVAEHPLISVDGTETYPNEEGELRLTTVTSAGGPGFPVTAGSVLRGWLAEDMVVQPAEAVFAPDVTEEERSQAAARQMASSQQNATVSALTALGHDVPAVLTIVEPVSGSGAVGAVQRGDVITDLRTADGEQPIDTYQDLSDALAATAAGSTVTLTVDRDGAPADLEITTGDDGQGGAVLGVYLNAEFDYPIDVQIEIDNVGGPSAGTMFALGIIDLLTPGPIAGPHVVAGTGTITPDGQVGPIGGIRLKMLAALRDGAEYFLAPVSNCDQVVGHVPEGLQVIRVATLAEAEQAVQAIADGSAADLPSCAG